MRFGVILLLAIVPLAGQPKPNLSGVRSIYVEQLGTADGATLVREKLIAMLANSTRFEAVDDRTKADGILSGYAETREQTRVAMIGGMAGGGTYFATELILKLTDKEKRILWAWDDTKSCGDDSKSKCALKDLEKAAKVRR